jgi:hypothetical protein
VAEASLTPTPAEFRNMVEAKRYYNEAGEYVDLTEEEKLMLSKKSEDDYEESESVDDMVEGLEMIGATPEEISMTIFDGIEEDLISDSMHCLYKRMLEGVLGVYETSGDAATVNAILQEFHNRSLDLVSKLGMSSAETMMMEMENMKSLVSKQPTNIKEVERSLRDALDLSRSKAKTLAKMVWENLRDVEIPSEPEIKTKQIDVDKENMRQDLLKKALKYRL